MVYSDIKSSFPDQNDRDLYKKSLSANNKTAVVLLAVKQRKEGI